MNDIYVISMTNAHERRQHIDNTFAKNNISFSYFNAIIKTQVPEQLKKYNISADEEAISVTEMACFLSHYCLWQKMIIEKRPYSVIFEDDVYLSEDTDAVLNKLTQSINEFDVIKLETMYQSVLINKGSKVINDYRLCHILSRHMGCAGYILSYEYAKKLVAMVEMQGLDQPVDSLVFKQNIASQSHKIYQLSPAICIQSQFLDDFTIKFDSDIEEARVIRKSSKKVAESEAFKPLTLKQKVHKQQARLKKHINRKLLKLKLTLKGYRKVEVVYKN